MMKKGFTLIEMLVVIVLIGVVIGISVPSVRKITYTNKKRRYDQMEKMVGEAVKLYVKSHKGTMGNSSKDCFSIQYSVLLREGYIEEEDLFCSGNIIAERTNDGKGYNYEYYLTCRDKHGKVLHEPTKAVPLTCELISGNFIVDYDLYEDSTMTKTYHQGTWKQYVYGKYSVENPYNSSVKYEYSKDLLNWQTLNPGHQEYTNYKGNIYVRAVESSGCMSNINSHIVWADSNGPVFSIKSDEHSILDNNSISISLNDVLDDANGIGVENDGYVYSYDNGNTWTNKTSSILAIDTTSNILVKDRLANTTVYPVKTVYACSDNKSGSATTAEILSDKTAWVNGKLLTGTMKNNDSKEISLEVGSSYVIPEGYHDGSGKVTATNSLNQEKDNSMIFLKTIDDSCGDECRINLKEYSKENYINFTLSNFFFQNVKSESSCDKNGSNINSFDLDYDSNSGILSIKNAKEIDNCDVKITGDIYLFCDQVDCIK